MPFTAFQTSSIGVASPLSAKNRMRWPENQVKTSCGVPCRYDVIWFWNVPWSTVLMFTLVPPLAALKASTMACTPALEPGSDA